MPDAALRRLAETGWLTTTPESFRAGVLAACRVRTVARGEPVYGFDDPPGGLWGLAEGTVAIEIASGEHGLHVAHVRHPGAWLGAAALLGGAPRRVGVVATRPCVFGFLSIAAFTRIATAEPEAWRWLGQLAVLDFDIALAVASDLMIRNTTARVAAVLLHLGGCRGGTPDRPAEIDLSQSDLARITALSRTAIAGQLKRLKALGLIEADYRRLRIPSPARLKAFVDPTIDDPAAPRP